ncbi:hypothetical protein [Rubinisphaera italica]|uniref:NHL repeat protein n=1 Tax=Rubinisphaera italica TaxID=2527969 RepID=A0A5C5XL28_9PLAN|nr:hypothetical protein [Rubinisphaera italica]TWT63640.1 NHL repeat protein [Rubinisphaera italica]
MKVRNLLILCLITLCLSSTTLAEPDFEVVADQSDGLNNPFGVTFDSDENLYIIEYEGGRIFKMSPGAKPELFAGKPENGFAGDGGPVREAVFNGMHNAVCSEADQLYISDTRGNRIRKVDLKTGIITTIAGKGKGGFSGDGGPSEQALLNDPISIALNDKAHQLLISDLNNRRIRSLDLKSGIIKTIAGNGKKGVPQDGSTATKAPLVDPRASDLDSQGNLYILERGGHALRVVNPQGQIRTVAGTGKASAIDGLALESGLNGPKHICIDGQDRVIIADAENHLIRLYNPKSETVSTILGREVKLRRPHGVAVHKGWLYICDSYNNRVLRLKW